MKLKLATAAATDDFTRVESRVRAAASHCGEGAADGSDGAR